MTLELSCFDPIKDMRKCMTLSNCILTAVYVKITSNTILPKPGKGLFAKFTTLGDIRQLPLPKLGNITPEKMFEEASRIIDNLHSA